MRASIPVFASREANQRAIRGLSSQRERRLPPQKKRTCTSQLPPKRLGRMAKSAPTPKQAKMKPGVMTSKTKRMSAARSHSCHMGRRESNSGIVDKCLVRWSWSKVNQGMKQFTLEVVQDDFFHQIFAGVIYLNSKVIRASSLSNLFLRNSWNSLMMGDESPSSPKINSGK